MSEERDAVAPHAEPGKTDDGASELAAAPADAPPADEAPARAPAAWRPAAVVLLLALAVIAAVTVWQQRQQRTQAQVLEARVLEAQGTATAAVQARVAALEGRLDTLEAAHERLQRERGEAAQRVDALERALSGLYEREDKSDLDWVLAEVEYLLTAANQRLLIEADVGTAIAAVRAADRRIRELGDPTLTALRERLTADLNALRAVPEPDLTGMALELGDFLGRVPDLPLARVDFAAADAAREAAPDPAAAGWRGLLGRMWADLVDLVDVERLDVPDAVLTDPSGRRQLLETLRMELAGARLAVLRRDGANLHTSAERVIALLRDYFDTADAGVASMLETLERLRAIKLRPELPALDGSLDAVRRLRSAGE